MSYVGEEYKEITCPHCKKKVVLLLQYGNLDKQFENIQKLSFEIFTLRKRLYCLGCGKRIDKWFIPENRSIPLCNSCRSSWLQCKRQA